MAFAAVGGSASAQYFTIKSGFIRSPAVKVGGENATIKKFRPTQVTVSTGIGLTSATLVKDGARFHESVKNAVGQSVTISVGGKKIFQGRVTGVNRGFDPNSERLSLICAGFNSFDLNERDFIYGQKAFQVDKSTGIEDFSRVSFFNRLPCIFNQDGMPNRSTISKTSGRTGTEHVFETSPVKIDPAGNHIRTPTGAFWTPRQMLQYIINFAMNHPESTSMFSPRQIRIHDPKGLLKRKGLDEENLLHVNVNRLTIGGAIAKVFGMMGLNWYVDVSGSTIGITPISPVEPGKNEGGGRKDVHVPAVPSGNLPEQQIATKNILKTKVNLRNGEIKDSTIGSSSGITEMIAHTEPEYVWSEWKLRPGWDSKIENAILKKGPKNLAAVIKIINDSKKAKDPFGNFFSINPIEVRKRLNKYLREWIVDEDGGRSGEIRNPFVFNQLKSLRLTNTAELGIDTTFFHTTRTHSIRPRPFKNKRDFINTRNLLQSGRPESRLYAVIENKATNEKRSIDVKGVQARALSTHAGITANGASLLGRVALPQGLSKKDFQKEFRNMTFFDLFFESGVHGDNGRTVVVRSGRFKKKTFKRAIVDGRAYKWRNTILTKPGPGGGHDQIPVDESLKLQDRLQKTVGDIKDSRKAASFTIPSIEVGYDIGDWIGQIAGRNLKVNSQIVGLSWNFEAMTTTLNLEDPLFRLFSQFEQSFPDGSPQGMAAR